MDDAKIFLSFHYPEVKDLCKTFLTLIAGLLVFSVTFSEKIIDFQKAPLYQRIVLLLAWLTLIFSLSMCGLGLYTIYLAGEAATGSIIYDYGYNFKDLTKRSYIFLDLSGVSFVFALAMLIATSIPNIFRSPVQVKDGEPKERK